MLNSGVGRSRDITAMAMTKMLLMILMMMMMMTTNLMTTEATLSVEAIAADKNACGPTLLGPERPCMSKDSADPWPVQS